MRPAAGSSSAAALASARVGCCARAWARCPPTGSRSGPIAASATTAALPFGGLVQVLPAEQPPGPLPRRHPALGAQRAATAGGRPTDRARHRRCPPARSALGRTCAPGRPRRERHSGRHPARRRADPAADPRTLDRRPGRARRADPDAAGGDHRPAGGDPGRPGRRRLRRPARPAVGRATRCCCASWCTPPTAAPS